MHRILPLAVCVLIASAALPTPSTANDRVNFHRDVRPLLSENCFACHGPDEQTREADLRLDIKRGAFSEGSDGPIIQPGSLKNSQLISRIASTDPDVQMPPPDSGHELSPEDINTLKQWVEQGAKWEDHWAFVSIGPTLATDAAASKESPKTSDSDSPIDGYIASRLKEEGLSLTQPANRRELIRRLTLDLTGLPPKPADIDAFLNNESEDAYEQVVDRLLASPHFGERMAVAWLDQARYADTNGYSIDGGRHMWLWRDWVIKAYNDNMPFDQFAIEQLAGDLLPDPTVSQKVATGFNRNHMITHEGGTIGEENLVNYTVDRVKTTSEVFLGLTMGCAQCHDHKYDPITQKDFYRFFAFFNTLEDRGHDGDRGINASPKIKARSVLSMEDADKLRSEIERLEATLAKPLTSQREWEIAAREKLKRMGQDMRTVPCSIVGVTEPNSRGAFEVLDGDTVFAARARGRSPSVSARLPANLKRVDALRLEFLPHESFPDKRSGHGGDPMKGGFVLTGFHASTTGIPSAQVDPYGQLKFRAVTASHSHPDYPPEACLDGRDRNGWSPFPENDATQSITFELAKPIDPAVTPFVTTHLVWGGADKRRGDLVAGKYRVLALSGSNDQSEIPADVQAIIKTALADRTAEQTQRIQDFHNSTTPELANVRFQLANLQDRLRVVEDDFEVMVMNMANKPRKTHMLNRGQYDQKGEEVAAGIPEFLGGGADGGDRLALAKWITSDNNPLTARVAVNRLWQLLFGTGLVATSADFGSQGEFPSHPQLLDWLAKDFVDHEWDVKRAIKQIVMSQSYQQSSRSTPALNELDPGNRLLSRGPRFRLQAEFVRDLALAAGDLLSPRIGGPSVRPYQPPGLWREISHYGSTGATAQIFVQDHGDKLYRRSMYTYWKRTAPPPSLTVFDAPNREVCTVRRSITNTPLQALVLLNDPQYVEASRKLAERMIKAADKPAARIERGFELVLGRQPTKKERQVLRRRLAQELKAYRDQPQSADALLSIGESKRDRKIDSAEHAAWTTIANLILNLSEAITRG